MPGERQSDLSCDDCPQCTALLAELSEEDRQWAAQWLREAQTITYERGEKIINENMPALGVYLVCRGRVKVVQRGEGHKEQLIKIVGPAELLGEESFLGDGVYTAYARAMDPIQAKFIDRSQFEELVRRCPSVWPRLAKKLALEVKAMQRKLLEASFSGCKARVARLVVALARAFGQRNAKGQLQFDFTRLDLANMAGISVETAIRTLSAFEKQGWIQVQYHTITLLAPEKLRALSQRLGVKTMENVL